MHVHNTFPLLTGSVLVACAKAKVPVVVTIHNYRLACATGNFFRDGRVCHDCTGHVGIPAIRNGCYRQSALKTAPVVLGNVVQSRAWKTIPSAYIFVSNAERQAMASLLFPPERTFVKWNLVEGRAMPESTPANRVVYIGRLDEAKGLPVLMRAWDHFRSGPHGGKVQLAIAGSGPLEHEVRSWAEALEEVEVLGMLDPHACRNLLAGSLAAVVPSSWEETFGLVAIEAMSAGVPVIGAALGALPELLHEGKEGELFRPGDADDLARILVDVATEPDRWRVMGTVAPRLTSDDSTPP